MFTLQGCLEGIDSITNYGYGLFYNDQVVPLTYPIVPDLTLVDGKVIGKGFHHGRFIMNLRRACQSLPDQYP